jgi:hypothetical protein
MIYVQHSIIITAEDFKNSGANGIPLYVMDKSRFQVFFQNYNVIEPFAPDGINNYSALLKENNITKYNWDISSPAPTQGAPLFANQIMENLNPDDLVYTVDCDGVKANLTTGKLEVIFSIIENGQ